MIKRLANRLFRWFCHPDYYPDIRGDLEEIYGRNAEQGMHWAQWRYFFQVIGLFRPSLIRSFPQLILIYPAMFRNYFKISTRMLFKHKLYSAINILGLAVGMGVCLLIYQYIHFELSYDQFHENAENTYRLTLTTFKNGENLGTGVYGTYALGVRGKETIPEIEDFVRVYPEEEGFGLTNPDNNEPYQENGIWFVDSTFLKVFNFPLALGDPKSALDEKYNIVLTETMAAKYFKNTNPIGKILKISGGWASDDYVVTGVLKKLPVNSHMQFDFLLPMQLLLDYGLYKNNDGWTWPNFVTYITIHEAANHKQISKKFDKVLGTYIGDKLAQSNQTIKIELQAITDVHLKSDYMDEDFASNNGDIQNIRFFLIIAIFILLMAWVNYVNLSTARAMNRTKEVGVRKSMGAIKRQLVSQFMVESLLINALAAVLSIAIAYFLLPVLNNIIGKELAFDVLQHPKFWVWFSSTIIFGALLSGLYPAFVLSSFTPVRALKSAKVTSLRGFSLRKSLIVFQFLTSVLLISGTYLVYRQISFMKSQDLGIDMEKIIVIDGPRFLDYGNLAASYKTFKDQASNYHSITRVASSGSVPGKGNMWRGDIWRLGQPRSSGQVANVDQVDADFSSTYDLRFLAGGPFTKEMVEYRDNKVVIMNEEAVKAFGFGSPEEAINQKLVVPDVDTIEIVGVVENFHWHSLKEANYPNVYMLNKAYGAYFSFKINLNNIRETIAHIKSVYDEVYPGNPFNYFFLDEDFNRQYQADLQFGNLFSAFSLLAIFIACLGLFALVSYSATLRVKEIGIRKVFGAGLGHLMLLLSREYLVLLCIAVALAVPAIILGGKAWLENYAYQVGIGFDLFLIPGLVLLVIALLTVSYRTYAAANANPVESLRTE